MYALLTSIQEHWIDFLSMVATVATMGAAFYALNSWKQQRGHEIKIEVFSMSRRSIDLIRHLRNPITSSGEMNEDILKDWRKFNNHEMTPLERSYLIFHSRLKHHQKTYEEILLLRERIWAEFDENHIFNQYFDFIAKTIIDLSYAHQGRIELSDRHTYSDAEFKDERQRLNKVVISFTGDQINETANDLFKQLLEQRKK